MRKIIALVAVMDRNRVIGKDNALPWHLPADLKHFKALTRNHSIIMGRKTYASIGRPLPQRENIVVTRKVDFDAPGCIVAGTLTEAISKAKSSTVMIVGGAQIYQQALPLAQRMYLTFIEHAFAGDTYFPAWDERVWQESSQERHQADDKNPYCYSFVVYDRVARRE